MTYSTVWATSQQVSRSRVLPCTAAALGRELRVLPLLASLPALTGGDGGGAPGAAAQGEGGVQLEVVEVADGALGGWCVDLPTVWGVAEERDVCGGACV